MSLEKDVNVAIRNAFDREDLQELLRFEFDLSLDDIAGNSDYVSTVFNVVRWFQNKNRLKALIQAAKIANPENEVLKGLTVLDNIKHEIPASLELIVYRLQLLEEKVQELRTITVGPDGSNGIRSVVDELIEEQRNLTQIIKSKEQTVSSNVINNKVSLIVMVVFSLCAIGLISVEVLSLWNS